MVDSGHFLRIQVAVKIGKSSGLSSPTVSTRKGLAYKGESVVAEMLSWTCKSRIGIFYLGTSNCLGTRNPALETVSHQQCTRIRKPSSGDGMLRKRSRNQDGSSQDTDIRP